MNNNRGSDIVVLPLGGEVRVTEGSISLCPAADGAGI